MNKGHESFDLSQSSTAKDWSKPGVKLYKGCWVPLQFLQNVVAFQQHYKPSNHDSTVILASTPKTGTTWLKALVFSILNRNQYTLSNTPLLTSNPHDLVPFLETVQISQYERLFSTHGSFSLLPESVVGESSPSCRVVYICRNPLDTITSSWIHANNGGFPSWHDRGWTVEDCIDTFCRGESVAGPFWDHVLGYWKASLEKPEKVLFVKYEDMMEDSASHLKRIAEFVGFPFSEEEQKSGKVEEIIEFCSLRSLKELDVNKIGKSSFIPDMEHKILFRKGKVGDWVNHLTPSMVESVRKVMEEKLEGSGLTFKYSIS